MSAVDIAVFAVHLVFAGVWTGSVVFATVAVLPTAMDGSANATPLASVVSRLTLLSRTSALVLVLTGGHMAAARYTPDSLTGSRPGQLVLAMLLLWGLLAAFVEIGASKLASGFDEKKVREPAREARPYMLVASGLACLLLVDAGVLASGLV